MTQTHAVYPINTFLKLLVSEVWLMTLHMFWVVSKELAHSRENVASDLNDLLESGSSDLADFFFDVSGLLLLKAVGQASWCFFWDPKQNFAEEDFVCIELGAWDRNLHLFHYEHLWCIYRNAQPEIYRESVRVKLAWFEGSDSADPYSVYHLCTGK